MQSVAGRLLRRRKKTRVLLHRPSRPRLRHWPFHHRMRASAVAATRPPCHRPGQPRRPHPPPHRAAATSSAVAERRTLLRMSSLLGLLPPATRTARPIQAKPGQPSCLGSRAARHGPCHRRQRSSAADPLGQPMVQPVNCAQTTTSSDCIPQLQAPKRCFPVNLSTGGNLTSPLVISPQNCFSRLV